MNARDTAVSNLAIVQFGLFAGWYALAKTTGKSYNEIANSQIEAFTNAAVSFATANPELGILLIYGAIGVYVYRSIGKLQFFVHSMKETWRDATPMGKAVMLLAVGFMGLVAIKRPELVQEYLAPQYDAGVVAHGR